MRPASKTATDSLGSRPRSQAAAARPVNPPPMMATSTNFGKGCAGGRKFTRQGGVPQCTGLADLFAAWRMAGSGVWFGTAPQLFWGQAGVSVYPENREGPSFFFGFVAAAFRLASA